MLSNTFTALTAVGTTNKMDMCLSNPQYSRITVAAVVATIGTNVVYRVEGSLDGTNWFNLDAADTTITTNGVTSKSYNIKLLYVRFNLVSFSTGSPSVTPTIMIGI